MKAKGLRIQERLKAEKTLTQMNAEEDKSEGMKELKRI
jgi:hypothetical protein